jgi:anti-anti-sigma factor
VAHIHSANGASSGGGASAPRPQLRGSSDVTRLEGDIAVVSLYGEHDLATKAELADLLEQLVRAGERVIVDLSEVEYVDSSALNNFVQADRLAQTRGLRLTVQIGSAANVATLLDVTGLRDYLPIAGSREEAILLASGD